MHSVEIENVLNVYNNIANHFDKTRSGYIWAGIKNFINSLDPSSIMIFSDLCVSLSEIF